MFSSFDYVIKEMVNVAAVQPWSYGCTLHVYHFLNIKGLGVRPRGGASPDKTASPYGTLCDHTI